MKVHYHPPWAHDLYTVEYICKKKKKKKKGWSGGLSLSSLLVYQYFEQTVNVLFPYVVAVCKGEITGLNQPKICWLVGWVGGFVPILSAFNQWWSYQFYFEYFQDHRTTVLSH